MIPLSIHAKKWKSIIITIGDLFGSYLRLRPSAIWLVLLWMVTYKLKSQPTCVISCLTLKRSATMQVNPYHIIVYYTCTFIFVNLLQTQVIRAIKTWSMLLHILSLYAEALAIAKLKMHSNDWFAKFNAHQRFLLYGILLLWANWVKVVMCVCA